MHERVQSFLLTLMGVAKPPPLGITMINLDSQLGLCPARRVPPCLSIMMHVCMYYSCVRARFFNFPQMASVHNVPPP